MSHSESIDLRSYLKNSVFKMTEFKTDCHKINAIDATRSHLLSVRYGVNIQDVTLDYKSYSNFFGDYKSESSVLAELYPEFLGDHIVKMFMPRTCLSYGRFLLTMYIMRDEIFLYQRERHEFSKVEACELAEKYGYRYVYCEDLS